MLFQIKVRVDILKMAEFVQKLQMGELDRSCIRGDTHCLKDDPAVGYSIWEAESRDELETVFAPWRKYYAAVEIKEVITPVQAMGVLFAQLKKQSH